jgi:hypothetical protein
MAPENTPRQGLGPPATWEVVVDPIAPPGNALGSLAALLLAVARQRGKEHGEENHRGGGLHGGATPAKLLP